MESVYSAFRVYRDIIFASTLLHNLVTVQALNARFDPTGQIGDLDEARSLAGSILALPSHPRC